MLLHLLLFSAPGLAQEHDPPYEEVAVLFTMPGVGNSEISVLIQDEEAWLPIKEVFDFLRIKNSPSAGLDSLNGFFIDSRAAYLIDKANNRITFRDKVLDLAPADLVRTETGLYLSTAVFCRVFGLDCQFSFRNLTFTLRPRMDLPALRDLQQEQLRRNLQLLKGEKKADTTLKRSFKAIHLGMADWAVTAMQETDRPGYLRASLSLGATVAGGEANVNLNYYSGQPFSYRRQYYRWRYVNNDLSLVKQVLVGRIATQSVSSIFAPVSGIQITNAPTTSRKSFGTYRYTGTTEPEWMVELYVNNVLVNYAKADASGFFAFDIPMVYGNSSIRLKFYGPWGEEQTKEEIISIPFHLLPARQLEYVVSAGIVDDESHSRFSRASFNYGLSTRITIGGGTEYLSSVMSGRPMPYLNASVRIGAGLIVNGEYTPGVRTKGTLNYLLLSHTQLDLSYVRYHREQTAIRYHYLEERKASVSLPLRIKSIRAISRLTYQQYVLPKFSYSHTELLLSAAVAGISSNLRTYVLTGGTGVPTIYSDLSFSFRLPYGVRFTPLVQYQYNRHHFSMLKADAEKRITQRGYVSLGYQNNRHLRNSSVTLGFRYDLSFARTFFSVLHSNGTTAASQSASGSLIYEGRDHYARASNQASVGRGGFIVLPFLDINGNGRREAKEPIAPGLNLRVGGGRVERRNDGTLLITGLEAYASYLLELDKTSFDNIAWQIKQAAIRATVEPNRLRTIEVPIAVVGEASGMVYLQKRGLQKGLSRILVNFYDSTAKLVAKTLTEGDGYFSYLGLAPGRYTATMDSTQLRALNLTPSPERFSFTINGSEEGTVADGFAFVLRPLTGPEDTVGQEQQAVTPQRAQHPSAGRGKVRGEGLGVPVAADTSRAVRDSALTGRPAPGHPDSAFGARQGMDSTGGALIQVPPFSRPERTHLPPGRTQPDGVAARPAAGGEKDKDGSGQQGERPKAGSSATGVHPAGARENQPGSSHLPAAALTARKPDITNPTVAPRGGPHAAPQKVVRRPETATTRPQARGGKPLSATGKRMLRGTAAPTLSPFGNNGSMLVPRHPFVKGQTWQTTVERLLLLIDLERRKKTTLPGR